MKGRRIAGHLLPMAALALAYFAAGKLGLALKLAHGNATPAWAPTGISLAALLIFGRRLWPGIALGAFLVNATTSAPLAFSLAATVGNTAAVLSALWIIDRRGGVGSLEQFRQVVLLVAAALVSAIVSASIGTGALWATGVVPRHDVGFTWWVWWLGDSLGFILVTPLLLTWVRGRTLVRSGRRLEAAALAALLAACTIAVFGPWNAQAFGGFPLAYAVLPFVLWAALRFGPRGATLATVFVASAALWAAARGYGPLTATAQAEVLFQWQIFSMIVGITSVGIAGLAIERTRNEDSLRFLAEASEVLAGSLDIRQTLGTLAELGSRSLADWVAVDLCDEDGQLQRVKVAHRDPAKLEWAAELERQYPPREGGNQGVHAVLATGAPTMVVDIPDATLQQSAVDEQHYRVLKALGLRSYMLVPIVTGGRPVGVISFISAESERHYGPSDLLLAQELARRAGLAIENARLYAEAVRAEETLRRYSTTLEQRVEERTAALREQNDQMVEFSYSISHDLRGPIRAIRGYIDVLADDLGEHLGPEGREYTRRIDEATRRMDALIQNLLAYSRLGKVEMAHEPVQLTDIVAEAVTQLTPELDERHARLRIELEDGLPAVIGHRMTLVQAVTNLLHNAAKFVPRERTPEIRLRTVRNGSRLQLWVEDNGLGILAEHQERIFRVFERLHSAEAYSGTGIGLAMVKRAVERMGGKVGVDSELGRGSQFWIELVIAEGSAPTPAPGDAANSPNGA